MSDFLFEIGLEEVPARMIASAGAELARRVTALLERERLIAPSVTAKSFSTPRRLAVLVSGVTARQQDLSEDLQGPSTKIAYKDGVPTPAAHAFAKKAGVAVEALRTIETPKGEYLAAAVTKPGRSAAEVIAAELPKELAAIYWAKNMYWRPGKPERFVRPVRWLLALLDEIVVPVDFAGYTAANLTYGHRVLTGADPITITSPETYAATLEAAFVLADVEARRHKIRKALDRVCRSLPDTRWREDEALVDKLTHLTEWPSVIAGSFEPEYLTLPEEVLVTVMRDHQNYFAVEDKAGKLAPHFLAVLNTVASTEGEAVIRHGNERVLRARFNDARFFWEFDQKIFLNERIEKLSSVTFQTRLGDQGSYRDKVSRIEKLCGDLIHLMDSPFQSVPIVKGVNESSLTRAVRLCKTDLTTELVKEFTELQGQIGGLYAKEQGEDDVTSIAIYEHYLPASPNDPVPQTVEGCLLSIADKADTIAGMFAVGLEPTGSKDPFALRRAANSIIRILAEAKHPINRSLPFIARRAAAGFGEKISILVAEPTQRIVSDIDQDSLTQKLTIFLQAERLEYYLREVRGYAYDVVKAVLAVGADDVLDAIDRAEALTAVRGSEDFAAVSAAFKRMKNILAQAAEKGYFPSNARNFTGEPAELELMEASEEVSQKLSAHISARNYRPAFEVIATLRPQVDRYFKEVMVLDPDPVIRGNRLLMLSVIVVDIRRIADLSEIVTAG